MRISIDAVADVELADLLERCSLGEILKEIQDIRLNTADRVGLGLFLNTLNENELRDVIYGADEQTAKKIVQAVKFYGKVS
ncbi:hypothetical protein [Campylobacter concisus]|jgi:hypothetical protein|uniref:hypothetical protein n=1 Tax=Campylobacter concisus TaxID=199 RepID=UPI00054DEB6B|nr:hypothetical protein [Campylobacter concisus]